MIGVNRSEQQVLRFPTPRTKTRPWGPRFAQDDIVMGLEDFG
jgi:hypothetical protein